MADFSAPLITSFQGVGGLPAMPSSPQGFQFQPPPPPQGFPQLLPGMPAPGFGQGGQMPQGMPQIPGGVPNLIPGFQPPMFDTSQAPLQTSFQGGGGLPAMPSAPAGFNAPPALQTSFQGGGGLSGMPSPPFGGGQPRPFMSPPRGLF